MEDGGQALGSGINERGTTPLGDRDNPLGVHDEGRSGDRNRVNLNHYPVSKGGASFFTESNNNSDGGYGGGSHSLGGK